MLSSVCWPVFLCIYYAYFQLQETQSSIISPFELYLCHLIDEYSLSVTSVFGLHLHLIFNVLRHLDH